MDRGEKVFGANWIEQWRENYRERSFPEDDGKRELEAADDDGCDVFSWRDTPQGYDIWVEREHTEIEEDDDDEWEDEDDDNVPPLF